MKYRILKVGDKRLARYEFSEKNRNNWQLGPHIMIGNRINSADIKYYDYRVPIAPKRKKSEVKIEYKTLKVGDKRPDVYEISHKDNDNWIKLRGCGDVIDEQDIRLFDYRVPIRKTSRNHNLTAKQKKAIVMSSTRQRERRLVNKIAVIKNLCKQILDVSDDII
jgi:hypothetical protein